MVQSIDAPPAVNTATGISLEHAIIHYLDPDGDKERMVVAEINFSSSKGAVARERLEHFLKRSYDQSLIAAEAEGPLDTVDGASTLGICWHTLDESKAFVSSSVLLARRLTHAMRSRHNISKGDMFVAIVRDALGPMICILKLAKWEVLERRFIPQRDGTFHVDVTPTENVISTRTIPHKCAFIRPPDHQYGSYVRLNDNQAHEREMAAHFFVEHFLGCRIIATSARRTIDFCVAAEAWRQENRLYLPRQGVVSFAKALNSLLDSSTVSFHEFAQEALAGANVNEVVVASLINALSTSVYPTEATRDVGYTTPDSFTADGETAKKLLESIDLTLSNGIRICGPRASMLNILEALDVDREEGDRKLVLPLSTTTITRKFPGSGVIKFQDTEDQ